MKKIFTLFVVLFIALNSYAQSDTIVYRYSQTKAIKDKLTIKRLSLSDVVTKDKTIPKKIRNFKNLEVLSLRPIPTRFARPRGGGPCIIGYAKTKTTSLPSWMNELKNLETLDLIGINNIDYFIEMKKFIGLSNLKELSIDPEEFNNKLIEVLIKFSELKSLKIRALVTDEQLANLKTGLPNCEFVTGLYADY